MIASGQPLGIDITFPSHDAALAAAHDTSSPLAYARFAAVVRHFMTRAPLPVLVERAGSPDFEAWLAARP